MYNLKTGQSPSGKLCGAILLLGLFLEGLEIGNGVLHRHKQPPRRRGFIALYAVEKGQVECRFILTSVSVSLSLCLSGPGPGAPARQATETTIV